MGIIEKLFNRRVLLWLFVPLLSFSQNFNENICFPLWTMHTYDTTIYGMSVGIHSGFDNDRYVRTNGLRMELPGLGFAAVLFLRLSYYGENFEIGRKGRLYSFRTR